MAILAAASQWTPALTVVSTIASILYLVEFVGRFAIARWRKRPAKPGWFLSGKRVAVLLGASVPGASFFVSRDVALTLVTVVFVAVLANEYRTWRTSKSDARTPASTATVAVVADQLDQLGRAIGKGSSARRAVADKTPVLKFGVPYVRTNVPFNDGAYGGLASFAVIPVWNEGTEEARDLLAWISAHTTDGTPITPVAKAHWADRHVAGQRSITLPSNKDPHALDLAMRMVREKASWLYDDESPHDLRRASHLIREEEFVVRIHLDLSNGEAPPDAEVRFRVSASSSGPILVVQDDAQPDPASDPPRDFAPASPVMSRVTEIQVEQIADDRKRRERCITLMERGSDLKGEVAAASVQEMKQRAIMGIIEGDLGTRLDRWLIDSRGFVDANTYGPLEQLVSEERETELIDEWTKKSVLEILNSHLATLKQVKDSIPPTRLG